MRFANTYYELEVFPTLNRINLKLIGFWPSTNVVPDLIPHWQEVLNKVTPGFTLLVDADSMKTPPEDVKKLQLSIQKMVLKAGVSFRAEVVSQSMITQYYTQRLTTESGLETTSRQFATREEAEAWLDEVKPLN